jgi:hypothetical protein
LLERLLVRDVGGLHDADRFAARMHAWASACASAPKLPPVLSRIVIIVFTSRSAWHPSHANVSFFIG